MDFLVSRNRQETSSVQETVAKSLDMSVVVGWEPISASVSASLNATTTGFQQVVVTEQTTTHISPQLTDTDADRTMLVFV